MPFRRILSVGLLSLLLACGALVPRVQAAGGATSLRAAEPADSGVLVPAMNGKQLSKSFGVTLNTVRDEPDGAIKIAPHRAIYNMTLASAKNGGNINGVTGRMMFEWADTCDGWAVQQNLQLRFTYAEGDESEVNSTVISWEAKDGTRYNFNVRRVTNGKDDEIFRGRATLGSEGGMAQYTVPKDKKDMALQAGTMFPSAHTREILEKALEKERFFTRNVFDGSDEDGLAIVSAFIGERHDQLKMSELTPELRSNSLLAEKAWPIRLAFFKPESETGESDYEMDLVLQANGVARSMLIDYGDFAVSGILSGLETLPVEGCHD